MGADPRAASDPTPVLREQAIEAAALAIYRENAADPDLSWPPAYPGEDRVYLDQAEAVVAVVWPLAERAALDGAERALRDRASSTQDEASLPGWRDSDRADIYRMASTYERAADLVASLRDGEPGG